MYSISEFRREDIQNKFHSLSEDLNSIYNSLPETVGCMDNIAKEDSCGAWCCREQNPSVWFVEFVNSLTNHMLKMSVDDFIELIQMCLRKYLLIDKGNGCVMWDSDTKKCTHHNTRPVNCYFYGVTPEEEFKPRYDRLKVLNNDIKPQCDLIKLKSGDKFMSKECIDSSFDSIKDLEQKIGVPVGNLTDDLGGSYRSYPEHLLIWILGEDKMCDLSVVRSSHSIMDKKKLINEICECLRESFNNV